MPRLAVKPTKIHTRLHSIMARTYISKQCAHFLPQTLKFLEKLFKIYIQQAQAAYTRKEISVTTIFYLT